MHPKLTKDPFHRCGASVGTVRSDVFCQAVLAWVEDKTVAQKDAGIPKGYSRWSKVGEHLTEARVVQTLLAAFFCVGNAIDDADYVVALKLAAHIGRQTLPVRKHCLCSILQQGKCGQEEENGGVHGDDRFVKNW